MTEHVEYTVRRKEGNPVIRIDKALDQRLKMLRDFTYNDDDDAVIFVDGEEGSGKSQFARQIGWLFSKWNERDFGMNVVHNDLSSYMNWVLKTEDGEFVDEPGRVSILDEGKKILSKFRQMESDNKQWTDFMSENRGWNVIHIICAPSFHSVDRNTAKWRTELVIHLKKKTSLTNDDDYLSGVKLDRGEYEAWWKQIREMYETDMKYPDLVQASGRATNVDPLTNEELAEYEKQKKEAMRRKYAQGKGYADETNRALGSLVSFAKDNRMMSEIYRECEDMIDMPKRTFTYKINQWYDEMFDADK